MIQDLAESRFAELQRRIKSRLLELDETPTVLAVRAGLGRDFIRDLIRDNPRKKGVRSNQLPKLASALDVDEEYLTLRQSTPRKGDSMAEGDHQRAAKPRFGGFLEAGVWRSSPVETDVPRLPSVIDPSLNIDVVYIQKGESLSGVGVHEGFVLYAEKAGKSEPGDVVVIRRTMEGGLIELSARVKAAAGKYELRPAAGAAEAKDPPRKSFTEVEEAVVKVAQKLYR
jgi:hypothetical protein